MKKTIKMIFIIMLIIAIIVGIVVLVNNKKDETAVSGSANLYTSDDLNVQENLQDTKVYDKDGHVIADLSDSNNKIYDSSGKVGDYTIDTIYKMFSNIKSIGDLAENYTLDEAINDNYLVITGAKVYNDNLYDDFMNLYENKENCFIRVVNSTDEGDPIIIDVAYLKEYNRIFVIEDNTRDEFASSNDRIISIYKYEKVGEYDNGNLLFVAYNGELSDSLSNQDDTFVIGIIN